MVVQRSQEVGQAPYFRYGRMEPPLTRKLGTPSTCCWHDGNCPPPRMRRPQIRVGCRRANPHFVSAGHPDIRMFVGCVFRGPRRGVSACWRHHAQASTGSGRLQCVAIFGFCQKLLLRRSRLMRFGEVQVVVMVAQAAQTMTASPRLVNSGAGFAACLAAMDGPVVELNRNLRRQLGCILIWGSTLDAMSKFVASPV